MVQRARKGLKGWAYPIIMAVMATGIVIEAFLLVPVIQRQSEASRAGQDARVTQCRVRPVTIRKENWFHASGVTSELLAR
jgi:hypothetical protein